MDIRSDRQKGLSYVELGRKYHMDPRTAKRYAESPQKPEYTLSEPKPTKMDPYKQIVDEWLEEAPYSALRISPETQQLVKEMCPRDNCRTQNEFIERAIRFYAGYVSGQEATAYLPPALASVLRGTVQDTENRICRLLFKLAVELDMVMNVLAAGMEISDDALRSLRGRCVQNVKKTSGSVTLDKAVEYQRGGV